MPNGDSGLSWTEKTWRTMRDAFRQLLIQLETEPGLSSKAAQVIKDVREVYRETALPYDTFDQVPRSDKEIEERQEAERQKRIRERIDELEDQLDRLHGELE